MTAARNNLPAQGRHRAVIENVLPCVDCGRFPIKRTVGETVAVEAEVFTDGHDQVAAVVRYCAEGDGAWREVPMVPLTNDCWRAEFPVGRLVRHYYTVAAWVDGFLTWRADFARRRDAADIRLALAAGANLLEAAAERAQARGEEPDARELRDRAVALQDGEDLEASARLALAPSLLSLMQRHPDRALETVREPALTVVVERERARYGAWYELFPRSFGGLRGAAAQLPQIAEMGFDVVYLPPIHPVGVTRRKGPNNALTAGPEDPGSPWAIGHGEGGHKSIHPELGSLADFRHFLDTAADCGMEVALDVAFQCSPDHPYVRDHPQWFAWRPDGTIQYAENPPKKYQDIYPFDFETDDWQALWRELLSVFEYWLGQGVRIFRVDNPHTKPFPFWEWAIAELRREHPDAIFLSEAFARPHVMHRLAKLGFSQSYTYFTWRNTKRELEDYFDELTQSAGREYLRPNLWPNTPDILSEYLQVGGRPAFVVRLVLAATLGASYGIYGPAFELAEAAPREPGSEEYLDTEKFQARQWDLDRPDSLRPTIALINGIRRNNPALHWSWNLRFHHVDNPEILCYSKRTDDLDNVVVVVVNLDPRHRQSGWVTLPGEDLELPEDHPYQMHDLLTGSRYLWHGPSNYVELDPHMSPAHVFQLRRRLRTEHDFAYYM